MIALPGNLNNFFSQLERSMGTEYLTALKDPQGWQRISGLVRPSGADREGEILIVKTVPDTQDQLRLFRWDSKADKGDPFKYSIEVGPVGYLASLSFSKGMCGDGEPQLSALFEAAFAQIKH